MFFTRRVLNTVNNFFFHNYDKWSTLQLNEFQNGCIIKNDFITKTEENTLLIEVEPHMKRLRYEKSHWDDVIKL